MTRQRRKPGTSHNQLRIVLALRSEVPDDDLAVSAALPLLTVAAALGELELIYPLTEPSDTAASAQRR